jgi:hypothetical protein
VEWRWHGWRFASSTIGHGRASDGGAQLGSAPGSSGGCELRMGTSGGGLGRDVVVGWAGMEEFQRKMSWAAKVN